MEEDYSDMTICYAHNIFTQNLQTACSFRKASHVFEYFAMGRNCILGIWGNWSLAEFHISIRQWEMVEDYSDMTIYNGNNLRRRILVDWSGKSKLTKSCLLSGLDDINYQIDNFSWAQVIMTVHINTIEQHNICRMDKCSHFGRSNDFKKIAPIKEWAILRKTSSGVTPPLALPTDSQKMKMDWTTYLSCIFSSALQTQFPKWLQSDAMMQHAWKG